MYPLEWPELKSDNTKCWQGYGATNLSGSILGNKN